MTRMREAQRGRLVRDLLPLTKTTRSIHQSIHRESLESDEQFSELLNRRCPCDLASAERPGFVSQTNREREDALFRGAPAARV